MKGLESGKDRVKKICDALRKETLEPAKSEAEEVLRMAHEEAKRIQEEARAQMDALREETRKELERKKKIFEASLHQSGRQAIELLKQKIETKFFQPELTKLIGHTMRDSDVIAKLITAVVEAIKKEGLSTDVSVAIASSASPRDVNEKLARDILESLREKSVVLSPIGGGVTVKFHKDNITLDLSDTALAEIVGNFIRKDFLSFIFGV